MQSKNTKDDFVTKNFLLISLEEKKAKKIAEAINSETARKILDHLSKKAATESELSKELQMPMSTVHYNLKQLQEANLVVVEEFHYSQKGKEINHYSLANKYIIIAPKNDTSNFMDALKKVLPLVVITVGVAAVMQLIRSINTTAPTAAKMMQASDAASLMMESAPAASTIVPSTITAWFLAGALAVIVVYFLYELIHNR
jgi:DNA-binding transcriptional ArsR family regulator